MSLKSSINAHKTKHIEYICTQKRRKKPMNDENKIILYQDDNEITRVSVRFADEDLWLAQGQLVEICQTSKSNVSEH